MAATFRCNLVTPERQVLDEEVTYASIPAWDGQIGLMHQRAPLLAKLGNGELKLELPGGTTQRFFIGGGFAQMKNDKLSVVTTEAIPEDQITQALVDTARKDADGQVARTDEDVDRRETAMRRARVLGTLAKL